MKRFKTICGYLALIVLIAACKKDDLESTNPNPSLPFVDTLIVNESGFSPLTATNYFQTSVETKVEMTIRAKTTNDQDFVHHFNDFKTQHSTPILGLYQNHNNVVLLKYINRTGQTVQEQTHLIQIDSLGIDLPEVTISRARIADMSPGWTLVNYFGKAFPNRPFIFDNQGNIRWVLDYATHSELNSLRYDNGVEQLSNGNFIFGDIQSNALYEVNMLGAVVKKYDLGVYAYHHQIIESKDGNIILTASKSTSTHLSGDPTVEDYVIKIDRNTGSVITEWDLKNTLDENRTTWTGTVLSSPIDWFHGNGLIEDEDENIIVTGRTQGAVKYDKNKNLKWIVATHNGWDTSRLGTFPNQFLLQPLDANDQPITDTSVLNGHTNHPDFEWPWYPHAPKLMPNGNLILFDNGDNRNYSTAIKYSRAVEYEIDEQNMTIKQVWSYGKANGLETYSRIVSDVDYLADKDNVLFSPGFGINEFGLINGGVIQEIDYSTKAKVFEALINPSAGTFLAFTRTERMHIYN